MFWRHYFIVKLNCFILRTTTVAGLGVPIFRVFTVIIKGPSYTRTSESNCNTYKTTKVCFFFSAPGQVKKERGRPPKEKDTKEKHTPASEGGKTKKHIGKTCLVSERFM